LGLIIDELATLSQHVPTGDNPLVDLLEQLINVYMRNHRIYFTCCHRSIYQVDEKLRNSLFSLGTYLFGRCDTPQEARELGDLLWKNDPFRVKHSRTVWGKVDPPPLLHSYSRYGYDRYPEWYADYRMLEPTFPYYVLATEPEFMSLEDQREEAANRLTDLGLFEFMLRPSLREGAVSSEVSQVNLARLMQDKATGEFCYLDQAVVAGIRSQLETVSGTPIKTLLAEQDALLPSTAARTPVHQPPHRQADSRIRHRENQQGDEAAPETPETAAAQPHTSPEPRHQRRHRLT
jgi:hypothetical protein